ncbi:histidine kinase [Mastigocladus laminosus UU774]|nr:histidine kinase [Mastigocladus laminosus UU774]
MPNAQCPMPNAQCPMPNAQCPMPHARTLNIYSAHKINLGS